MCPYVSAGSLVCSPIDFVNCCFSTPRVKHFGTILDFFVIYDCVLYIWYWSLCLAQIEDLQSVFLGLLARRPLQFIKQHMEQPDTVVPFDIEVSWYMFLKSSLVLIPSVKHRTLCSIWLKTYTPSNIITIHINITTPLPIEKKNHFVWGI